MHSHLLPGLDDGVKTFEEALSVVLALKTLGYNKFITTPHVISDIYRNTTQMILDRCDELNDFLTAQCVDVTVHAAAEYYLDESLIHNIRKDEPLLTFGNRFLLFETNFVTEPLILKEFIFLASTKGYKLILAHPERYLYLHDNFEKVEDLKNRGVLFQVNISSLAGHYSRPAQKLAQYIIDKQWIDFLGTDCHNLKQVDVLRKSASTKYFEKAVNLPLLNHSL
ncbi:MAG TPA: CpsB/CapC family capsule biosynthesis tyrosine phosphatase [Chryseosolibacter sp.]|nr:CpsB/CapC family capsule biosynthesis tyrosine phosphatase [Chryseosolibacter sp.]